MNVCRYLLSRDQTLCRSCTEFKRNQTIHSGAIATSGAVRHLGCPEVDFNDSATFVGPQCIHVPNLSKSRQSLVELLMIQPMSQACFFTGQYCSGYKFSEFCRLQLSQFWENTYIHTGIHRCSQCICHFPVMLLSFETRALQRRLGGLKSKPIFALFHPLEVGEGLANFRVNVSSSA